MDDKERLQRKIRRINKQIHNLKKKELKLTQQLQKLCMHDWIIECLQNNNYYRFCADCCIEEVGVFYALRESPRGDIEEVTAGEYQAFKSPKVDKSYQ